MGQQVLAVIALHEKNTLQLPCECVRREGGREGGGEGKGGEREGGRGGRGGGGGGEGGEREGGRMWLLLFLFGREGKCDCVSVCGESL